MKVLKKKWKDAVTWVVKNRKQAAILFLILLGAAFVRLYKIDSYMTFLGDEGRDVIVVRRLLVDFDIILVGPGTSIGNMYLGPLYYYMMAPALLLAGFSPVGPAIMIALLGVLTVGLVWFIGREWFGDIAGYVAAFLYAISPTIIIYSRSSWNPNIMPFFALLGVYSAYKVWRGKSPWWIVVTSICFAFALQSHYLALIMAAVFGVLWGLRLIDIVKLKKKTNELSAFVRATFVGGASFILLMSPLVIFDARHGWRNFEAMKVFFTERQTTVNAKPWKAIPNMWPIYHEFTERIATAQMSNVSIFVALFVLLGFVLLFIKYKKARKESFVLGLWMLMGMLGLSLYKQEIYDHYYGFLYPVPFLVIGALVAYLYQKTIVDKLVGFLFVAYLGFLSFQNSPLRYPPNNQYHRSVDVSQKVIEESHGEPFNIAVLAERNYEGAYQYFMEKEGVPLKMIDPQRVEDTVADQLFVICELPEEKCDPTHSPKSEVANFGWSEIENTWNVEGVTVYKLIHSKPDGQ